MINDIREEKVWAEYIFVKIACDAIKKRIDLYKDSIEDID